MRNVASAFGCIAFFIQAALAQTTQPSSAPAGKYVFWMGEGDGRLVQFLMALPRDLSPDVTLKKPIGAAMHGGKVFIADVVAGQVAEWDIKSGQAKWLPRPADKSIACSAITVGDDGSVYACDIDAGSIHIWNEKREYARTIALKDMKPTGLAIRGDEIFVCDFRSQYVRVLSSKDGKELRNIGSVAGKDGQFVRPLSVALDQQGNIYVADVLTGTIQKFDAEGKLQKRIGEARKPGGLVRLKHIAVDKEGLIYAVDGGFDHVQIFDADGAAVLSFGKGTEPGAMSLPIGVSVDEKHLSLFAKYIPPAFEAQRLILVTNQSGDNKVGIYAIGVWREENGKAAESRMNPPATRPATRP